MSYETNPILNRIKLVKGWKNSSFPTKTLNYSRDLRVWFKLYLFLKVYLLLYGLRLLTYEVRLSDKYTKCVCLSITKLPTKKKLTAKWKDHSFLKNLKSPLSWLDNKKGRFLLYLDVQRLKKKVFSFLNNTNQRLLSQTWSAKPQTGAWINTSFLIWQQRKRAKLDYQLACKRKAFFLKRRDLFCQFAAAKKRCSKKENAQFFWEKKERTVFSLLTKMQKDVDFFEKYFHFIWKQALLARHLTLFRLVTHLENQLQKKKNLVRKFTKLYLFLQQRNLRRTTKPVKSQLATWWSVGLKKKKVQLLQFHFLTQQPDSSQKNFLFLPSQKQRLSFAHHQILVRSKRALAFQKRFSLFKHHLSKNRTQLLVSSFKKRQAKNVQPNSGSKILKQKSKTYLHQVWKRKEQHSLVSWQELPKTTLLQKPYCISFRDNLFWIRLAQKKRPKGNQTYQKSFFYRWSLQQNYRKFLTLATQIKLKCLLQDVIKKYFALTLLIKISWPLLQFKNLKFYRLVFPQYKMKTSASNQKIPLLQHPRLPDFRIQKYIYVGQTTSHVKFRTLNMPWNYKNYKNYKHVPAAANVIDNMNKRLATGEDLLSAKLLNFLNLEKEKLGKRNTYLAWKRKQLNIQSQERLAFVSRIPFISVLLTTLTLFGKYLDPQPLADHLAKLIGKTKKHAPLLKLIETILRTFPLKRGLGYRIALIGRINGANKSRTLYLRKLKRNRPRQTFSKKVNFAVAHARARIGAFAVKIWVYL